MGNSLRPAALVAGLCLTAAVAIVPCAPPAAAQSASSPAESSVSSTSVRKLRVSVDHKNAEVRGALTRLFNLARVDYVIDPNVGGTVTVKFTDVPFEEALRRLLHASKPPLTYKVKDKVYHIALRNPADAALVAKNTPDLAGERHILPAPVISSSTSWNVSVDYHNAPIRDALESLFRRAHRDYSIDSAVTGTVTLKVTNQPFDDALRLILEANSMPLTFRKEDGVYLIKPKSGYSQTP